MDRLGEGKFKFWDVEGTPVATLPTASGGLSVQVFDTDLPRDFRLDSVRRTGASIALVAFERLLREFQ